MVDLLTSNVKHTFRPWKPKSLWQSRERHGDEGVKVQNGDTLQLQSQAVETSVERLCADALVEKVIQDEERVKRTSVMGEDVGARVFVRKKPVAEIFESFGAGKFHLVRPAHVTGGVSLPVVLAAVTDALRHSEVDVVRVDTSMCVVLHKAILAGFKVKNYVESGFLLPVRLGDWLDKTGVLLVSRKPLFADLAFLLGTLVPLVGSKPLATVSANLVGMYTD